MVCRVCAEEDDEDFEERSLDPKSPPKNDENRLNLLSDAPQMGDTLESEIANIWDTWIFEPCISKHFHVLYPSSDFFFLYRLISVCR